MTQTTLVNSGSHPTPSFTIRSEKRSPILSRGNRCGPGPSSDALMLPDPFWPRESPDSRRPKLRHISPRLPGPKEQQTDARHKVSDNTTSLFPLKFAHHDHDITLPPLGPCATLDGGNVDTAILVLWLKFRQSLRKCPESQSLPSEARRSLGSRKKLESLQSTQIPVCMQALHRPFHRRLSDRCSLEYCLPCGLIQGFDNLDSLTWPESLQSLCRSPEPRTWFSPAWSLPGPSKSPEVKWKIVVDIYFCICVARRYCHVTPQSHLSYPSHHPLFVLCPSSSNPRRPLSKHPLCHLLLVLYTYCPPSTLLHTPNIIFIRRSELTS
jgi:hypothetical protein